MKLQNENDIVLVDDDEVDALFLRRCLEQSELSNELIVFRSGRLFLDHMAHVRVGDAVMPALVLLDINMPGLGGVEVLEALRQHEEFRQTPVTLYSNSDDPRQKARAEGLNADFMTKFSTRAAAVDFFNSLACDA